MKPTITAALVCMLLAACGGGDATTTSSSTASPTGDGTPTGGATSGGTDTGNLGDTSQPGLFDTTSNLVSGLYSLYVTPTSSTGTSSSFGSLTHSTGKISAPRGLDGQLNGSIITLDVGGQAELSAHGNKFSAMFVTSPQLGASEYGVVGIPTDVTQLPTSASYSGVSSILVNNGNAVFDLFGTSNTTIDFANGTATVTLSNLDGTRATGSAAPTSVSNFGTVSISNMNQFNGVISGGSATVNSTRPNTALSGSEITTVDGAVFGPNASEVGGVLIVDDTTSGSLRLEGSFLGQ